LDTIEVGRVQVSEFTYGLQPMINKTVGLVLHRCLYATTAVVPAHDHVAYVQNLDRVLKHGKQVQVAGTNKVGYVSMNENFTRLQSRNHVGGHPAVGAPDPQIFRPLQRR
jgi:hypothetical protein